MFNITFDEKSKIGDVSLVGDSRKLTDSTTDLQNALNRLLTATVRISDPGDTHEVDAVDPLVSQLALVTRDIDALVKKIEKKYELSSWLPHEYSRADQQALSREGAERPYKRFNDARDRINRSDEELGR